LEEISTNHFWAARCFRVIFGLAKKWNITLPDDAPKSSPLILKSGGDEFTGFTPENSTVPILSAYTQPVRASAPIDNPSGRRGSLPMRLNSTTQAPNNYTATLPPTSQHSTYTNTQSMPASTYAHPPPHPQSHPQLQHNQQQPTSQTPPPPQLSNQLFWAPPIPGTMVPLLGADMNVSPMDLSMLVSTSSEWEQFDRDGFRMSDAWSADPALGGQLSDVGGGYPPGAMGAYAGWMGPPPQ